MNEAVPAKKGELGWGKGYAVTNMPAENFYGLIIQIKPDFLCPFITMTLSEFIIEFKYRLGIFYVFVRKNTECQTEHS